MAAHGRLCVGRGRGWGTPLAAWQLAAFRVSEGLVFTTHHGAALDAGNVRKMFRRICTEAGIGDGWTPRELQTSSVSLLSHQGVATEEIARLAGTPPPAPPRSSTDANCDQ